MITAIVILYIVTEALYETQALFNHDTDFEPPSDIVNVAYWYHKLSAVSLIASWLAILSVKTSFLALFKRLIDRLPRLIMYWRAAVIFNLLVAVYGISEYIIVCPYFNDPRGC